MALVGAARALVVTTAVMTGLATVGLVRMTALVDLDTAGQAASVTGAAVGLAALLVSVISLFRDGNGPTLGRRVRAGRDAVAVGGDLTGSAVGKNSQVTGPPTAQRGTIAQRTARDVRASRDGIAVGGDVTDSALGEGSER